jgi:hypothetical protein
LGKIKVSLTIGKPIINVVDEKYHDCGFNSRSSCIESCIIYAFQNKFHEEVSEEQLEHLKAYQEIGRQAEDVKPLVFMGQASDTLKKAEKKFKQNVKLGLMTKEQMHTSLERLRKKLRKSVQTTLKDQEKKETEERAKRKKAFLKKRGYKVTKNGKVKKTKKKA